MTRDHERLSRRRDIPMRPADQLAAVALELRRARGAYLGAVRAIGGPPADLPELAADLARLERMAADLREAAPHAP